MKNTVFPAEHVGGRIGVEEPLYAEPTHDTSAHLLGERGQIGRGNQSSRQERRRPVTGWHEDAVGQHLLRYCARPPFALERLSVIRGEDGRATKVRYVLPRHKAANWVGPGRGRKSTRPGASGVVELSPFEFLDRLADLVPRPRRHWHRYHGVFAPNHKLRSAVTAHDKMECRQAA